MNYLFDTNAILYQLKGTSKTIKIDNSDAIFCSFITKIELLSYDKISEHEAFVIQALLTEIQVVHIYEDIIEKSIAARKEKKLKLPDAIICATALSKNAILVTADKQLLKSAEQMHIKTINPL